MTATTHDPMCWTEDMGGIKRATPESCAVCDLIARVRANERERAAERVLTEQVCYMQGSPIKYVMQEAAFLAARGGE